MHLIAILCCFIPQIILAQQAELVLKGVEETRSIHYMEKNKLELITELTGIEVDDDHQIRLKEINGVDNLGNQLEFIGGYPYPNDYFTKQKEILIGFESPIRKVHSISVKGVIEYLTISEELQSKISFINLQQHYHKNLLAGVSAQFKLVLIDLEGLGRLKEEDQAAYHKKVKEIHKKAGVRASLEEAKEYLNSAVEDYIYNKKVGQKPYLYFYNEDPNKELVEIKIFDNTGTETIQSAYSNQHTYSLSLEKPLTSKTQLQIIVKNKKAVKEIPFQLESIELP